MMKLILRVAAVLVALGFLVAYVFYASGRINLTPKEAEIVPRKDMVISSSKTISQPVFSTRTALDANSTEADINLWEPPVSPVPDQFKSPPRVMGGSKSGIIKIYGASPTPAKP